MLKVITAFALAVASLPALAQKLEAAQPPVLKILEARGLRGLKEFKVSSDVRGFAGMAGSDSLAVYVTKDGSAIVGTRIDASGSAMDANAIENLVVTPAMEAVWQRLGAYRWVADGKEGAPRVVYVITDANCPWCHRFWEAARPWVVDGKIQLRHLLVGIIGPDSPGKAAAILESRNPSQAMENKERTGRITPLGKVSVASKRALDANLKLMQELGLRGTPGIIYRSSDGKVRTLGGFPNEEQLKQVLGPR